MKINIKRSIVYCLLSIVFLFFVSSLFAASSGTFWKGSRKMIGSGDSLSLYDKGKRVVLKGNVKLTKNEMKIFCDTAHIYQKKGYMKCEGNTRVKRKYDNGDDVEGNADAFFYDSNTGLTKMTNVNKMDYFIKKETRTVTLSSKHLEMNESDNTIVVRDDVKITSPFEEAEDTTVVRGIYTFSCDKLVFDRNANILDAHGNICADKIYENGTYAKVSSKKLHYDGNKKWGILRGLEKILYFSSKDNKLITLTGNTAELFEKEQIAKVYKNVHFIRSNGESEITSGLAEYHKKDDRVVFSDDPIIKQNDDKGTGVYKSDLVYYYPKTGDTTMEGRVNLEYFPDRKNNK